MGLPPSCFYPLQAFRSGGPAALAQVMENFFRSGWDPLVLGGVDGSNAHPNLAGGGLSWSGSSGSGGGGPYPPKPNPPPHLPAPWAKRLVVELADETADARIRKKGATGTPENRKPGIEFVIDPTDTTYGKVCFVAKQDLTKQIGSVILENPATVTNPKMEFVANYGKMRVGTSGAFDWELARNGTVTLDDNGTRIKAGRSALYLGGDDLSVERSAAGKAVLRDPSGGVTKPMLQFGGSTSSFPAIARQGASSAGLELRLADDSGQADLDANALYIVSRSVRFNSTGSGLLLLRDSAASSFNRIMLGGTTPSFPAIKRNGAVAESKLADDSAYADHAASGILGYGAATGFRTKMDFGTPSADKTITIPNRDLTMLGRAASGTNNKLLRFDANGDAQDAGVEDNGTTVSTSRKVTISGLFTSEAGLSVKPAVGVVGATVTLTEASETFQHLEPSTACTVVLPDNPTRGLLFMIRNKGATYDISIEDSSSTVLATLTPGEHAWCQHDNANSWEVWGLF